jgi:hypothetical protein
MLCLSFAEKQPINEPLGTASPPPSSNNDKSDFERTIDSLRQFIPRVKGNQIFSFKEFSGKALNWQESQFIKKDIATWDKIGDLWLNPQKLIKIDSAIWVNNFGKRHPNGYLPSGDIKGSFGKFFYYYKELDLNDNLFNIIVLEWVNKTQSYMYLVQFDKQGNRKKGAFELANIWANPDGTGEIYSVVQGNKIKTYSYTYFDDDGYKYDTTEVLW